MPRHSDNLLALSALGVAIGIYTFFKGFREFRKYRLIADTPAIPIRSVPMGLVQVRGQAQGDEKVTSPVSHTPCFWFQVVIEHWKTGSKGGGHWEHFRTDADGVAFYLADATGHVKVLAQNAELDLQKGAQREIGSHGSAGAGNGATDEELLRYVTKAGVHWIGGLVEKGIEHVGPLADPAKEEKRQALVAAFQHTPGTPEFMQRMLPVMAPLVRRRLESAGPQSDPKREQARQAMLQAFEHQPGSPEFLEALARAEASAGPAPGLSHFRVMMQPGAELSMFQPASGRFRLTESCVVPGAAYDITGTCAENPSPLDEHDRNMIVKGTNEPTFLITSKSEKQEESTLKWRAVKYIFGGAALAIISMAILLAKLGWL